MGFAPGNIVRVTPSGGLPHAATMKLERMREEAQVQHALRRKAQEEVDHAHKAKGAKEVEIHRIKTMDSGGRFNIAAVKKAEGELKDLQAECDRMNAARDAIYADLEKRRPPLQKIETWLEDHHRGPFLGVEAAAVERIGGETWNDVVARLRSGVAELKAEVHEVLSAPLPSKAAKALATKAVDELAAGGKPDLQPLLEGGKIRWAGQAFFDGKDEFDPRALLAWFDRDRIVSRLHAEIDAIANDKGAMTEAQRTKEAERLRLAILQAEREEEAAIDAAAADLTFIPRRMDADPRAILGLADNLPGYIEI